MFLTGDCSNKQCLFWNSPLGWPKLRSALWSEALPVQSCSVSLFYLHKCSSPINLLHSNFCLNVCSSEGTLDTTTMASRKWVGQVPFWQGKKDLLRGTFLPERKVGRGILLLTQESTGVRRGGGRVRPHMSGFCLTYSLGPSLVG